MRAPYQVLVIPFRKQNNEFEYAIFKRTDFKFWQFIAGGGEDGESIVETVYRELSEEIAFDEICPLIHLDSLCTIPRSFFTESSHWPESLYVVPEHCFAFELTDREPILSEEHTEYQWVSYEQAFDLLKWDSNKNALWELRERLKK